MKKIIAIILAAIFTLSMTACSKQEEQSDLDYVMNKGVLVVGVTEFEPMDYLDENGEWIGFDAELAKAFAESLGLKAEFVKIDWSKKTMELSGKTVDCIWNGMTLNDEVLASMECSKAYCSNAQIVILPKEKENLSMDDLKNLSFAVENGSAGQAAAEANGLNLLRCLHRQTPLWKLPPAPLTLPLSIRLWRRQWWAREPVTRTLPIQSPLLRKNTAWASAKEASLPKSSTSFLRIAMLTAAF